MDEAKDSFLVFDHELFDYTLNQLKKYGYDKIKTTIFVDSNSTGSRKEQILAINTKDKLRFVGEAWGYVGIQDQLVSDNTTQYQYQVKKKSMGSGYVILLCTRFDEYDLPLSLLWLLRQVITPGGELASSKAVMFFDDYEKIVVSIAETGSQEPRTFKSTAYSPHGEFIRATNQIKMARVVSLVTINDGFNTVNISDERIQEPGAECWFLIECGGYRGATFNLITDGEKFHPVARVHRHSRRVKIKKDVGKATVNMDLVNAADKELIHMAISGWIAKI